jgi:FKBP-type peptidyl-prolyl cis-trans isomerase FklB
MPKLQGLLLCLMMFASSIALAQKLTTKADSIDYALGHKAGKDMQFTGLEKINYDNYLAGVKDAMNNDSKIEDMALKQLVFDYMNELKQLKQEKVKLEGEKFLLENAKRKEITTTESGLQYEVLTSGKGGANPAATSKVLTHYHGTLIDGTLFDSSVERGEPISFKLNQVIPGWTEALQLMSEGDKWRLYIPYNLAYGERGAGGVIPGYATLIFDVELIEILD